MCVKLYFLRGINANAYTVCDCVQLKRNGFTALRDEITRTFCLFGGHLYKKYKEYRVYHIIMNEFELSNETVFSLR